MENYFCSSQHNESELCSVISWQKHWYWHTILTVQVITVQDTHWETHTCTVPIDTSWDSLIFQRRHLSKNQSKPTKSTMVKSLSSYHRLCFAINLLKSFFQNGSSVYRFFKTSIIKEIPYFIITSDIMLKSLYITTFSKIMLKPQFIIDIREIILKTTLE